MILALPNHFVETLEAAVQGVGIVIGRQLISDAIQGELPLGNAIAIPANQRAEIGAVGQITVQIVVAQHDIADMAITVGAFNETMMPP